MNTILIVHIVMTIAVYMITKKIYQRFPSPFLTPIFLSTVLIMAILIFRDVPYSQYEPAKNVITYALGPATVALAVPIYKNRKFILKHGLAAGVSLILGSTVAVVISLIMAHLFQITKSVSVSLSVKSATVPIALEIASLNQGDLALAAIFVMVTGMIGAMFGPRLLNITNISDPMARGLAIGTIAHGIGTAQIAREGEIQGAVAGSAMALTGVYLSIFLWVF
ncbi:LrgB family protein [Salipaludibacillus daqingensis]|uniref:LrgB family protein n=1 Tax=Salipaludibacillus daqingensis TaxID=3041001 RepID=UPI002476459B|nr:LrgB family protein [Salipaludibacillus daqingensis]